MDPSHNSQTRNVPRPYVRNSPGMPIANRLPSQHNPCACPTTPAARHLLAPPAYKPSQPELPSCQRAPGHLALAPNHLARSLRAHKAQATRRGPRSIASPAFRSLAEPKPDQLAACRNPARPSPCTCSTLAPVQCRQQQVTPASPKLATPLLAHQLPLAQQPTHPSLSLTTSPCRFRQLASLTARCPSPLHIRGLKEEEEDLPK